MTGNEDNTCMPQDHTHLKNLLCPLTVDLVPKDIKELEIT
jgi:hypothetical protein